MLEYPLTSLPFPKIIFTSLSPLFLCLFFEIPSSKNSLHFSNNRVNEISLLPRSEHVFPVTESGLLLPKNTIIRLNEPSRAIRIIQKLR